MFSKKVSRFGLSSLRLRLIGLFVLFFGTTLVVYSFLLFQAFVRNHENEFDAALYNYAVDVANSVDVGFFGDIRLNSKLLGHGEKVFPFALGKSFLQVRSFSGASLARSRNLGRGELSYTLEDQKAIMANRVVFNSINVEGSMYRQVSYLLKRRIGEDLVLQVAAPVQLLERERRGLMRFFWFSIPSILLVGSLGGFYLSGRALAPFNQIVAKSKDITAKDLSERVPVPEIKDEIRELAVTLNGLLDRLEEAFKSQETFVADASHQLKTPLAILKGELGLMKTKERSPEETKRFLESAEQEVDYLTHIIEDLLILAKVDSTAAGLLKKPVRLDEVVTDTVSRLKTIANRNSVRLILNLNGNTTRETAFQVMGDADLLRSLVENLIENGIKYSPRDTIVTIDLSDSEDGVELRVRDQGPGIPDEMKDKIFSRFFRSDKTRNEVTGSGLGLAVAKKIVDLHAGSIQVARSPEGGSIFSVYL